MDRGMDGWLKKGLTENIGLRSEERRKGRNRSGKVKEGLSGAGWSMAHPPFSAPETHTVCGLAGGGALCRRQIQLAAGTYAHLVHSLFGVRGPWTEQWVHIPVWKISKTD